LIISDLELNKPIGMISCIENNPQHLTIQLGMCIDIHFFNKPCIDNIWITPFFQGKKRSMEAMLLVLEHIFGAGILYFFQYSRAN
jgi:hypothetical protein